MAEVGRTGCSGDMGTFLFRRLGHILVQAENQRLAEGDSVIPSEAWYLYT